jgi:cellulose synthase/poly-beta-1,6-N-acetylglucosamine synthase-like glycosyltransferase
MAIAMAIRITVIIPCYKQGHFLAEAIDSVLNQGRTDTEIIVINDGSPDNTEEVAKSYGDRIGYIYQENRGLSAARNAGIRAARGNYLDTHPDIALVAGDVYYYDGKQIMERRGGPRNIKNFRWETVGFTPPSNTVMVRREVFDHVPLFDEHLRNAAEDWLMWVRIARLYNMAFIDEPLTLYRQHSTNATKQDAMNEGNRYASTVMVESPEFADYPRHYRAKLLYYRTATAWHVEPKGTVASLLLRAFLTDPLQIGYGIRVFGQGLYNTLKRKMAFRRR